MGKMYPLVVDVDSSWGYLALPEVYQCPGIVILHAWWGLTPFFHTVCDRLAAEGFVALAPDLYHGVIASSSDEAKRLRASLDCTRTHREIRAALDLLRSHAAISGNSLGVVGFSLGGYLALRLARSDPDDVRAAVVFYATEGGSFDGAQASFLGHFAQHDGCWAGARTVRSLEARLRAAGCEVTFHTYAGTQHSFFEHDRAEAFDAQAAELAWLRTVTFLHRKLGRAKRAIHTTMWPQPALPRGVPV
jgi:carboxymethylenebutenolidase